MNIKTILIALSTMNLTAIVAIIFYSRHADTCELSSRIESTVTHNRYLTAHDPAALDRLQHIFTSNDNEYKQEHINNAMGLYNKTLQAIPQISATLSRLSTAYAKLGNHYEAIAAYKASFTLNPSKPYTLLLPEHNIQKYRKMPSTIGAYKTAFYKDFTLCKINDFYYEDYYVQMDSETLGDVKAI